MNPLRAAAPAGGPAQPASKILDPSELARDRELVARILAGEERAFEELLATYGARLLAVAARFCREEHDAQDVVQDAMLSAFKGLGSYTGDARLYTWLHRIVVNAALMRLRARRRRPEQSIEELLPTFTAAGHHREPPRRWDEPASAKLERSETRKQIRHLIEQLPEPFRVVVLLRDIEELDTAETAQVLDITEQAVKTRLHRARQALRTLLERHLTGSEP
ncbi:MAG: sigma-70 family RNA polymerase sigma factor [Planctomycetes bacterium]|nr:sigma-70 family RNA polymerase sigma factor [Planctomycetota bacterium]